MLIYNQQINDSAEKGGKVVIMMLEKIKFSYKVADSQDNLFTANHTRFKCKIKLDGDINSVTKAYQESMM